MMMRWLWSREVMLREYMFSKTREPSSHLINDPCVWAILASTDMILASRAITDYGSIVPSRTDDPTDKETKAEDSWVQMAEDNHWSMHMAILSFIVHYLWTCV